MSRLSKATCSLAASSGILLVRYQFVHKKFCLDNRYKWSERHLWIGFSKIDSHVARKSNSIWLCLRKNMEWCLGSSNDPLLKTRNKRDSVTQHMHGEWSEGIKSMVFHYVFDSWCFIYFAGIRTTISCGIWTLSMRAGHFCGFICYGRFLNSVILSLHRGKKWPID